ncbi:MAG: hypothetical protein JW807_00820 [Spirochaetes bacterium]|nr:hypothetical protein [Spirochaetota bacterium]
MLAKIKIIFISLVIGAVLGAAAVYFIPKLISKKSSDSIRTTQISGEKISHRDYGFKGKSITFTTEAEGKGKIKTEIPKTLIPEARSWVQKVHGIEATVYLLYQDQFFTPYYHLGYWHRFGPVCIGTGIVFSLPVSYGNRRIDSRGSIGLKLGLIGWF